MVVTSPYVTIWKIFSSSNESFCLQVKIQHMQAECKKIPTPSHLIYNLAYMLKPHQTRNQYLRTGLNTCADVNIMPASVYNLVFNDPDVNFGLTTGSFPIFIYISMQL